MPKASRVDIKAVDTDLIIGELSRRSLKQFIKHFWPIVEPSSPFVDGWHIDAICDHLVALTKRQIRNLLINLPPRHCKSTLCSVIFPAWQWLHSPGEKFLYTSYAFQLAERDSVRCRRLIDSSLYQKCYGHLYKMSEDQNTKRRFENDQGGIRLIASVLSSGTTGEGGDYIVVDDPHNASESESDIRRQNVATWFVESFFNRINDPARGCRLVVGQRIHNEDLSGYILENMGAEWCHLNLPYDYDRAKAKKTKIGWTDPRKFDGQPLWPERFPESEINLHRKKARYFSTQFNQNPLDAENAPFRPEHFRYYDEDADFYIVKDKRIRKRDCFTLITADLAISEAKTADYTAICVAAVAPTGEIILLDMVRERMSGTKIVPRLVALNELYQPAYVLVEDVAFQRCIVDQARAEGLPVRQAKAKGDKESRSLPLQYKFEQGQVWFPKERPWVATLEKELIEFPQGSYDDQTDALSYMAVEAHKRTKGRGIEEAPPVKEKTWEEIYAQAVNQGLF
jgi:predicted phage terminase large subunit-like protein